MSTLHIPNSSMCNPGATNSGGVHLSGRGEGGMEVCPLAAHK